MNSGNDNTSTPAVGKLDLQRLVYICTSCLRLIRIYVNEIYPNSGKYLISIYFVLKTLDF